MNMKSIHKALKVQNKIVFVKDLNKQQNKQTLNLSFSPPFCHTSKRVKQKKYF